MITEPFKRSDCRIQWLRYGLTGKTLIEAVHLPTNICLDVKSEPYCRWTSSEQVYPELERLVAENKRSPEEK